MGASSGDLKQNIDATRATIADTVSTLSDRVAETSSATKDRLSDAADGVRQSIADATGAAADRVQQTQGAVRNPVPLLIGSAIVGFGIGLLAPLTLLEIERLQPVGDEIARRASDARDEIVEESKAVVTDTVAAARTSVQTHGRQVAKSLGVEGSLDEATTEAADTEPVETAL